MAAAAAAAAAAATETAQSKTAENPRVYFDITIGGVDSGRIVMELYADTTPKTAGTAYSAHLIVVLLLRIED